MTTPPRSTKPFVVARDNSPRVAQFNGAVAAIGNFDGVHRGHRAVIDAALTRATALEAPAIAITFEPHPRKVLRPSDPVFRLTDEISKLRLLAAIGLTGALVLTFDAHFAALTAAPFGTRPTFDDGAPLLEVHVFDFSGDLYGAPLDVAFIGWIRPELKFDSVDALVKRMDDDAWLARAALARAGGVFPLLGEIAT